MHHDVSTTGTAPPIEYVGQATANANSTAFTVRVPTTVQLGDQLLLFAAQGNTTPVTGPGCGMDADRAGSPTACR